MSAEQLKIAIKALEDVSDWKFGWDGDCGVTRCADEALAAIEVIAPPVAAESVDIAELRLMLIDHRHSDSRKEQDRHLDSIIYFVNAWAAQHVANAIKDQKERAEKAEAELAHKQAIIDRLMLEYCPDEMTAEQVTEWASHQKHAE